MENLLVLLDKIQSLSPLPIFAQETIVVENAGMQHWLNMSLAKQRGISMNMRYALPSQYLWKLIRSLASEDDVPEQSPYSREVLAWRIDTLLASQQVIEDIAFKTATQYWQQGDDEQLKRYQLACQLADLYEQYLIFRPEWIDAWHQGDFSRYHQHDAAGMFESNDIMQNDASWQGKLWFMLVKEQPYNPKELIALAIENLNSNHALCESLLPHRLSFFGINAMAPLWLSFIHALSEKIDIHFFHLNPCYAYWGDISTEKNAINAWISGLQDSLTKDEEIYQAINEQVGNPLLANLGQQGREFMALLYQYSTINIDVFESVISEQLTVDKEHLPSEQPILARVQQDILSLSDARIAPIPSKLDDSILITSAHSALREVQGLHDWLLHQFNQDKGLTPKDVLVMCPQVEQYAPYVNAVFSRGWQDIADEVPPLPCSIADRVSKDAEPLVAAFSELLNLPDSRFQVSSLVSLLRLSAMQARFSITTEDIDKISTWLDVASIHWGLDTEHKRQTLQPSLNNDAHTRLPITDSFTWQQGLARLLRGFAFSDTRVIYQDQLLLPNIEGADSELLGKLLLIIEQLQQSAKLMSAPRKASQWQAFLLAMLEELFDDDTDNGLHIVKMAIESLVEYCQHALFEQDISLSVLREFLNNHFSQPDPGRQFMVGQVTFCSMLPMRSIPFKIIAVLGLNDGEFPRQRQPLSFDLMASAPSQLGDRSRRGDDRYLFLEAIISARKSLYLSYQGRNIKNNKERQPSLVLKELMEYLARGYLWPLLDINHQGGEQSAVRQLPMQAFSVHNYLGKYASFDVNWLKLSGMYQIEDESPRAQVETDRDIETSLLNTELSITDIVRFYQHPSRYYAQHQLYLYLENDLHTLEDIEPFVPDRLESYLLREALVKNHLSAEPNTSNEEDIIRQAKLSGNLPDLPSTERLIRGWQEDSQVFSDYVKTAMNSQTSLPLHYLDCKVSIEFTEAELTTLRDKLQCHVTSIEDLPSFTAMNVSVKFPFTDNKLVFYRSSSAKAKDLFTLYLHQLILQIQQESAEVEELENIASTYGYYFDTKSQKPSQFYFSAIPDARNKLLMLLYVFHIGQQQPLLLNGELAEKAQKSKVFEQTNFEQFWHGNQSALAFGDDKYLQYFWPQCPAFNDHSVLLTCLYQPMFEALQVVK